jgi:hypothetical protein
LGELGNLRVEKLQRRRGGRLRGRCRFQRLDLLAELLDFGTKRRQLALDVYQRVLCKRERRRRETQKHERDHVDMERSIHVHAAIIILPTTTGCRKITDRIPAP